MGIHVIRLKGWLMAPLLSVASLAAASGDLRLVEAVAKQDKEEVRSLLKQHLDVNTPQADGATALHWAAHWDDLETAELLLRAGAKVNVRNDYGATPLSLACTNGNAAVVGRLLTAGANPNTALPSGETALMRCARTGSAEAVKSLLAHGADVNAKDTEQGQTALMWAVAQKHPGTAQVLLEHGADVNARSKGGFTPLLFAARVGDVDSARVLLEVGANVNEAMPAPENPGDRTAGSTPSTAAPQESRKDVPANREQEGAPPGTMTPLLMASASGQEALAIFLLEKGADPNARDENGAAALHYAVLKGITALNGVVFANYVSHLYRPNMLALVKALLAHGANPNVRLVKNPPLAGRSGKAAIGATPFLLAAITPDASVMRILAAGGAYPLLPTKGGLTPLMVAAGVSRAQDFTEEEKRDALEAVKLAVELGNDVNAVNEDGKAALHGAASNGADPIVQFLADQGAKLDVKDKYQQTPLSVASGMRLPWIPYGEELGEIIRKSTADLLLKLGATPLTAPDYFTPVKEYTDAFRFNQSQRYEGATAPR